MGPIASFWLDFCASASVYGYMGHDRIRDDISKGFADLTALLENAAGLAVEGQSLRCTIRDLEYIAASIQTEVENAIRMLAMTNGLIAVSAFSLRTFAYTSTTRFV